MFTALYKHHYNVGAKQANQTVVHAACHTLRNWQSAFCFCGFPVLDYLLLLRIWGRISIASCPLSWGWVAVAGVHLHAYFVVCQTFSFVYSHVRLEPGNGWRGCWMSWNWRYRQLWATLIWLLRTKPRSFEDQQVLIPISPSTGYSFNKMSYCSLNCL